MHVKLGACGGGGLRGIQPQVFSRILQFKAEIWDDLAQPLQILHGFMPLCSVFWGAGGLRGGVGVKQGDF